MGKEREELYRTLEAARLKLACDAAAIAYLKRYGVLGQAPRKLADFQEELGGGVFNAITHKREALLDETARHVEHKPGRVSFSVVDLTDESGARTGQIRVTFTAYGRDSRPAADVELVIPELGARPLRGGHAFH